MSQHVLQPNTETVTCVREKAPLKQINDFLESPWFVALVCLLTAISNLFGAELIVYTSFIVFAVYIALLGRDFLPIMPLAVGCYIAPSLSNNPGRNETSVFYPENGGIYLLVLFCIFLVCAVVRLITDKELGGKVFLGRKRKLMLSMLILGAGYVLAGAFSGRYFEHGMSNLLFALLQFLAVAGFYWFFGGAVRWERVSPQYFAWVGLGIGLTVCCQLVGVFVTNEVIVNSTIKTGLIASGWGNANNIGCLMAMMVPFALYLAKQTKQIWIFGFLALVLLVMTCLTCSRASILAAFVFYALAMIPLVADPTHGKIFLLFNGFTLIVVIALVVIFHEPLENLFEELVSRGFAPRMRDVIYPEGIRTFLENPIFGEGFYPSTDVIYEWSNLDEFKAILPARWHNTMIQLLASCGMVGFGAYLFHRTQTVVLFVRKRKSHVLFIGLSLAAMLCMSMLDCHFFNIGPAMIYSMGLIFAEKAE